MLSWNPETLQCLQPGVFRRWAGGVLEEGTSGRDVEDALDFVDTPSSSRLVALSCGSHPCGPAYTWCLMNAGAACCLPERPPTAPSHLPGSTWAPMGRGDTWVVPWPLEPPSVLGQGPWASHMPGPHQTILQLGSKHAPDLSPRVSAWRSQGTGVIRPLLS